MGRPAAAVLLPGPKVRLDITHDRTEISADAPLAAAPAGQAPRMVTGTATFRAAG